MFQDTLLSTREFFLSENNDCERYHGNTIIISLIRMTMTLTMTATMTITIKITTTITIKITITMIMIKPHPASCTWPKVLQDQLFLQFLLSLNLTFDLLVNKALNRIFVEPILNLKSCLCRFIWQKKLGKLETQFLLQRVEFIFYRYRRKTRGKKDDDRNSHPETIIIVRIILQSTTGVCNWKPLIWKETKSEEWRLTN